jgi:hypothetical protein
MNRFHPQLSEVIKARFKALNIETVLSSRARIPEGGFTNPTRGETIEIETEDGRKIQADYIVSFSSF